jgi:hypothetical protein
MRPRPCVVSVRLTEEEANAVQAAAERHALSAGQYLRARGLADGAPTLPMPIARRRRSADAGLLAEIAGHLGRIGGNVNQIAHAANLGFEPTRNELAGIGQDLRALRDVLAAALHVRRDP